MERIAFLDSHTGGEPTRLILDPPHELAHRNTPLPELFAPWCAANLPFLRGLLTEPRGSDVFVGAFLLPATHPEAQHAVAFFNNVGALGMCGHGTIGVIESLHHLGHDTSAPITLETPAGLVTATRTPSGDVSFDNVRSYCHAENVPVTLPSGQTVHGHIAYGGNWFYICADHPQPLDPRRTDELTDFTWQIRLALESQSITGAHGALIDHIELIAPSETSDARNFVLCPGKAYDRSPCGTGTSAKAAWLAATGHLAPGDTHRVESIIGSQFTVSYRPHPEHGIIPTITGRAHVMASGHLLFDPNDPFRHGLPTQ